MNIYQDYIKNIERPEKFTTILGAAVATVATAFFVKRIVKNSKEQKGLQGQEIPSPKGDYYFLGHIPLLSGRPAETVHKWHHELGPLVKVYMGAQTWVFIGEPEAAHEILSTKGAVTSGRPDFTFLTK
ncbi:Cytochrome P450 2 sub R member 1, partial [Rhizopus stolonifer]